MSSDEEVTLLPRQRKSPEVLSMDSDSSSDIYQELYVQRGCGWYQRRGSSSDSSVCTLHEDMANRVPNGSNASAAQCRDQDALDVICDTVLKRRSPRRCSKSSVESLPSSSDHRHPSHSKKPAAAKHDSSCSPKKNGPKSKSNTTVQKNSDTRLGIKSKKKYATEGSKDGIGVLSTLMDQAGQSQPKVLHKKSSRESKLEKAVEEVEEGEMVEEVDTSVEEIEEGEIVEPKHNKKKRSRSHRKSKSRSKCEGYETVHGPQQGEVTQGTASNNHRRKGPQPCAVQSCVGRIIKGGIIADLTGGCSGLSSDDVQRRAWESVDEKQGRHQSKSSKRTRLLSGRGDKYKKLAIEENLKDSNKHHKPEPRISRHRHTEHVHTFTGHAESVRKQTTHCKHGINGEKKEVTYIDLTGAVSPASSVEEIQITHRKYVTRKRKDSTGHMGLTQHSSRQSPEKPESSRRRSPRASSPANSRNKQSVVHCTDAHDKSDEKLRRENKGNSAPGRRVHAGQFCSSAAHANSHGGPRDTSTRYESKGRKSPLKAQGISKDTSERCSSKEGKPPLKSPCISKDTSGKCRKGKKSPCKSQCISKDTSGKCVSKERKSPCKSPGAVCDARGKNVSTETEAPFADPPATVSMDTDSFSKGTSGVADSVHKKTSQCQSSITQSGGVSKETSCVETVSLKNQSPGNRIVPDAPSDFNASSKVVPGGSPVVASTSGPGYQYLEQECPETKSRKPKSRMWRMTRHRPWENTRFYTIYHQQRIPGLKVRIVTYNLLSQDLLDNHTHLYSHCPQAYLHWSYRRKNLMDELTEIAADIYCLQEVHHEHYEDFIKPNMEKLGYQCEYKRRLHDKKDGCAILFKANKFQLDRVVPVEYYRPGVSSMDRDNVALLVRLIPKGLPHPLVVATTHLLFNPRRGDIKLTQSMVLLAEVDRLASLPDIGGHCPIVICGDFNMLPWSHLYTLYTTGQLFYHNQPRACITDQPEGGYFGPSLDYELMPRYVGITDRCRYVSVAHERWQQQCNMTHSLAQHQNCPDLIACSSANNLQGSGHLQGPAGPGPPPEFLAQCTGELSHNLQLASVYNHRVKCYGQQAMEVTSHHGAVSCTVDYIFYGTKPSLRPGSIYPPGQLRVLRTLKLLTTPGEIGSNNKLPNEAISSDHFLLAADFLLT